MGGGGEGADALREWLRHLGLEPLHGRFAALGLRFGDLVALSAQVERGESDPGVLGKMLGIATQGEPRLPSPEDSEGGEGERERQRAAQSTTSRRTALETLEEGLRTIATYVPLRRTLSARRAGPAEANVPQPQPQPQLPQRVARRGWSASRVRIRRAALWKSSGSLAASGTAASVGSES